MTLLWQAVLQGSVGFAIGAGTNDLAIRWLFATVFTKKKKNIAESVQEVVSKELMSSEKIIAKLSDPVVRAAVERNVRAELDGVFRRATSLAGGVVGGLRPFLPKLVRDEIDAVGKVGAALDGELRKTVAKVCAMQIHDYLSRNLPRIVEETDVWSIIYESIMALDEEKMEFLTRQIANRELRGITIWGGVIGAAVGVATSIVIRLIG